MGPESENQPRITRMTRMKTETIKSVSSVFHPRLIPYGFAFQFKMTVIGELASVKVFIRNRLPSSETTYC